MWTGWNDAQHHCKKESVCVSENSIQYPFIISFGLVNIKYILFFCYFVNERTEIKTKCIARYIL